MDKQHSDTRSGKLGQLPVKVSVRVCCQTMMLKEFVEWQTGTLLCFDQPITSPLHLCIGSREIGNGRAVQIGPKLGIEIARITH